MSATDTLDLSLDHLRALIAGSREHPHAVLAAVPPLLTEARRLDDRVAEVALLTALAAAHLDTNAHDEARALFGAALELAAGHPESQARVLRVRLRLLTDLGESRTVDSDYMQLAEGWRALTHPSEQASALNLLAGVCYHRRQMDQALLWLEQAMEAALKGEDAAGATSAALNMARIYENQGRFALALSCLRQAMAYAPTTQTAIIHLHLTSIYIALQQPERALGVIAQYFAGRSPTSPSLIDKMLLMNRAACWEKSQKDQEAIDLIETYQLHQDEGSRLRNHALDTLGYAYAKLGHTEHGRALLTQSLQGFRAADDLLGSLQPLLSLAELELPHRPKLTLEYAQQALGLLTAHAEEERQRARALLLTAQAHAAQRNHEQAYAASEAHRQLQERLNRQAEQQRLEALFAELEYERAQLLAETQRNALQAARIEVADLQTHLERRVAQRTQELQAANAELSAFARSLSHYLKTPMQLVMGYAGLLDRVPDPERQTYTDAIVEASGRMSDMLDGLLRYAERHAAAVHLQPVALEEIVRLAWQDMGPPASTVVFHVDPLPYVQGDPAALRLVFGNLLHNAVKYTQGRPEARVEVLASQTPDLQVIEVRDNGVGFAPAHAGRLFQVFSRLPEAQHFEGLGFGLADVWRVVIAHGGHVRAEGRPGEGASFFVSLPHVSGQLAGPQPS